MVELQGMWDFILPNEETQEALPFATQSSGFVDSPQTNPKQKVSTLAPRDKTTSKKSPSKSTQTTPLQSNSSPSSKTLIIPAEMEYNIIEDMKKTRGNITFHELSKLKY